MEALPGVILSGGRASRMGGGNKGLRLLAGRPLVAHVVARLSPQCGALAINSNSDEPALRALDLPVLPDSLPDRPGPLAGVLAGLDWAAQQGAPAIVTAAVDTPFFPGDLVTRLRAAAGPSGLALAASRTPEGKLWRQPVFGLWPTALRADLRAALIGGLRKIVQWTDQHQAGLAIYPLPGPDPRHPDPFFNVNTAEDLAQAETALHHRADPPSSLW